MRSFNALTLSLKIIEENYQVDIRRMVFCDCLGVAAIGVTIASCFGFKQLTSIEASNSGAYSPTALLSANFFRSRNISINVGRVQVDTVVSTLYFT